MAISIMFVMFIIRVPVVAISIPVVILSINSIDLLSFLSLKRFYSMPLFTTIQVPAIVYLLDPVIIFPGDSLYQLISLISTVPIVMISYVVVMIIPFIPSGVTIIIIAIVIIFPIITMVVALCKCR